VGCLILLVVSVILSAVVPMVSERRAISELRATPGVEVIQQDFPKAVMRMSPVGMLLAQFVHHCFGEYHWPGPSYHLIFRNVPPEKLWLLNAVREVDIVYVESATVDDTCLEAVGSARHLDVLYLETPKITPNGLRRLKGLPIRTLNLHQPNLNREHIKAAVESFPKLETLMLDRSGIDDTCLEPLRGNGRIKNLWLRETRVTDAGLGPLTTMSRLSNLSLAGTSVTDAAIPTLMKCASLNVLNLSKTAVTDSGLAAFPSGRYLDMLFLTDTSISDDGLVRLPVEVSLINVSRTRVRFEGPAVRWVSAQHKLTSIYAEGNSLSPAGVSAIKSMGRIEFKH
jgi:hypothetical protein